MPSSAAAATDHRLTDAELARYREEGWIVPRFRLSEDRVAALRAALDRLIAENPQVAPDYMLCPHLGGGWGQQKLTGGALWEDVARTPEILDIVEQIMGPDILLWGSTVFGKPASVGKETPIHQDGEYWPIRPLATVSVWIALDRVTQENGAMYVVPGTHRAQKLFNHRREDRADRTLNRELDDAAAAGARVYMDLEPGQMSMHDVYLVHGSAANASGRRRAGYVMRYMPATSIFDFARGAEIDANGGNGDLGARRLLVMRGDAGENRLTAASIAA